MHEFSLVQALVEQIAAHAPAAGALKRVHVRAGAARAIEPELMQWAWQAATADTAWEGAALELEVTPYRLTCVSCGRRFAAYDPMQTCACGDAAPRASASDELTLVSITMEEDAEEAVPTAESERSAP